MWERLPRPFPLTSFVSSSSRGLLCSRMFSLFSHLGAKTQASIFSSFLTEKIQIVILPTIKKKVCNYQYVIPLKHSLKQV